MGLIGEFDMSIKIHLAVGMALSLVAIPSQAQVITFSDFNGGSTYNYDAGNDGSVNVRFTGQSFGNSGPGDQMYVTQSGLEGGVVAGDDVRVDFLTGAINSIGFGFAISQTSPVANALSFNIFGSDNSLLAGGTFAAFDTPFTFAEGFASLNFLGTASYATINFQNANNRFLVDNFTVVSAVPEPSAWAMMLLGFGGIGAAMRKRRRRETLVLQAA